MIQENKKRPRRKGRKKKIPGYFSLARLLVIAALFLILIISICAVGYVIFFRTVFAQEILPVLRSAIVFEEPNPPVSLEQVEPAESEGPTTEVTAPEESTASTEPADRTGQIAPLELGPRRAELPKVAIIIDDMGYDEIAGQKLLDLPIELTYSFLPFAPHTKKLENMAHLAGKTIFLHLPLQPKGNYSAGPGALFLDDSKEQQIRKLNLCLQEVPHAVGVNNHMGSAFTEDKQAMTNIIQEMKGQVPIFVDSFTSPGSVAYQVALTAAMKSQRRNVFLDNIQDEQKICGQLEKLVDVAEKKGRAIGIGHPHRATVNALAMCGANFQRRVQYVGVPEVLAGN